VEDAVDALIDAQRWATETMTAALRDAANAPEPPEDTIEPVITAKAPDPLFTTADPFAGASRKLLDRKRLLSMDDEDGS
jgi:hypothetical protein